MYHFIVNPNARSGRGEKIWRHLKRRLDHQGVDYEAHLTEEAGDAMRIAASLTEGSRESRIIVVVGGDGTVNEVLNGLSFGGTVTLGYIPAGSGNDLARSLRLPKSPSRCLKKILNPKYFKQLDYGVMSYGQELNHRRFMVSAGAGMDAAVCHNLLYSKVKVRLNRIHLGKLSYVLIGLKQLWLARPVKGYLLLDGVRKVEFNHIYFVSTHIHPFEGGGFKFAPAADPCDGKLEVCVVHQSSRWRVIPFLLSALLRQNRKHRGVRHYTCREVEIYLERPMAVHADGESCQCQDSMQIRCVSQKVRVIV